MTIDLVSDTESSPQRDILRQARFTFANNSRTVHLDAYISNTEASPFYWLSKTATLVQPLLAKRPIDLLSCSHASEGITGTCPATFAKRRHLARHLQEAHDYTEFMCATTLAHAVSINGAANLDHALETIRAWASLQPGATELDFTDAAHSVRVLPQPRAGSYRFAAALAPTARPSPPAKSSSVTPSTILPSKPTTSLW
jgi:hypothetical protein